jgi:hypothetical protein
MMRVRQTAAALAALTLMLVATAHGAWAQMEKLQNTTPEQRAKAQTAMMKSKLDLTPEQLPKIAAINQKYAQKMEPVIKGSAGPLMKMRQMKAINEQKESELKQALSQQQFEKYLASKEEMREEFEKRLAEKRGGGAS